MVKKNANQTKKKRDVIELLNQNVKKLARNMERAKIEEYVASMKKPWKILTLNFGIGIARGLGVAIGMTIVFAIIMYMISKMVNLPLIGEFVARIVEIVNKYLSEGAKIKL